MMNVLEPIKEFFVGITPNYLRVERESYYYSYNIFQANCYIHHGSFVNSDGKATYQKVKDCHVFSMGTQDNMISDGWLKETYRDEYRDETILNEWLEENMIGFYATRGWGNGRHEYGQSYHGLHHVEVYIMRDIDAFAFRLRWGG